MTVIATFYKICPEVINRQGCNALSIIVYLYKNYPYMKTILLFFIAFVLTTSTCIAQPKLENSLLWKISGNELSVESYLFGTNHSVHHSFLDSIPRFWDAFNSAKSLIVELDITSQVEQHSFLNEYSKMGILLPKDSTYKVLYNSDDYTFIDEYMNAHGFGNLDGVNGKPALMSMIISFMMSNSDIQNINSRREENMEPYLLKVAKQRDMFVIQLDEKVEITNITASYFKFTSPLKEQAAALLELIKNEKAILKYRADVELYYKQYNLEFMATLNEDMKQKSPKTYDIFLNNRNDMWMEKIPGILKSGSSLIAVGVRHLVGDDGLINMLRKEGYTVEPVTQNKN